MDVNKSENRHNRIHLFLIIAEGIALIVVIAASVIFFKNYQESTLSRENANDIIISSLNQKLEGVNGQLAECKDLATSQEARAKDCETTAQDLQDSLSQANASYTESQKDLVEMTHDFSNMSLKYTNVKNLISCEDWSISNPDYQSNSTISQSLSDWVGDRDGSVKKAMWDVVYSNAKSAIHKVTGEKYLWVFVVTFDTDQNTVNSIYSVSGGCFLDFPEQ